MADRHEPELRVLRLLTRAERRRGTTWGAISLAGIALFVGAAVFALLSWDTGGTPGACGPPIPGGSPGSPSGRPCCRRCFPSGWPCRSRLALARRPRFPGPHLDSPPDGSPHGPAVLIGALGLIGIWGRQGIINGLLAKLGVEQPVSIYGLSGILLAHVFFNLPLAARLLLAALERLPAKYWLLSSSLGMRPFSVFRFIEWPAARRRHPRHNRADLHALHHQLHARPGARRRPGGNHAGSGDLPVAALRFRSAPRHRAGAAADRHHRIRAPRHVAPARSR